MGVGIVFGILHLMQQSLISRIFDFGKPFVLYHTHAVVQKTLDQAISKNKSMDLDVSIDDNGKPYLGHSQEYYKKSDQKQPSTMPLRKAVKIISKANTPVIVDCKHNKAWSIVEKVISEIGPYRCMIHSFVSELKFDHNVDEPDYPTEWSGINKLKTLKRQFPSVTTTASCKFLPDDLLVSNKYLTLLTTIRKILKDNNVNTVCLNMPDSTVTDEKLEFFLSENIIPHITVDNITSDRLKQLFIGETGFLKNASDCSLLGY